jgi:hypothetical protein
MGYEKNCHLHLFPESLEELGVLSLLYMLGVEPDECTAKGCDSLLRFCQHESGSFSMTLTRRSGIFPCTTGEELPFLVYFGLGDDARVRRAFAFVIENMSTEDALDCGRYQHRDCLWGAIAALKACGVPILIQAYPDDLDKMAPALRRDAFCGKFSIMDVKQQCREAGIPVRI